MSVHLRREVENLKDMTLRLCAEIEQRLALAIEAVEEKNTDAAKKVIDADFEIDNMEVGIEEECLKILALHQPVAIDLRFIVAILKINVPSGPEFLEEAQVRFDSYFPNDWTCATPTT